MRIWHQSMATLSEFGPYEQLLRRHIECVVQSATVDVHGASPDTYGGRPPGQVLKYVYLRHLIQSNAVDACLQAEAEGYDAVALATFGDPCLRECRSMVDIPVASMPEACLLVSASLAARCALICLAPPSIPRVRDVIAGHGLGSRVSGVYALEPAVSEHVLVELMSRTDIGEFISSVESVAKRAAGDGAELLIPAEGALNELLWSQEVHELGGLPILDALAATFASAQQLVNLRRNAGTMVSRVATFAKPPADLLNSVKPALRGDGLWAKHI